MPHTSFDAARASVTGSATWLVGPVTRIFVPSSRSGAFTSRREGRWVPAIRRDRSRAVARTRPRGSVGSRGPPRRDGHAVANVAPHQFDRETDPGVARG